MRLPWKRGCIESASWLADDTLFSVGWSLAPADTLRAWVEGAGQSCSLELRAIGVSRPDLPDRPHPVGKVMVLQFPDVKPTRTLTGNLVIDGPGGRFVTSAAALNQVIGPVATFVPARLGWLEHSARASIMAFLAETLTEGSSTRFQLANSLRDIRMALRDARRPIPAGETSSVQLDHVFRIDERSFYLRGWGQDADATPIRLTAVSPEGRRVELLQAAFRHRRPDLGAPIAHKAGFVASVCFEGPSLAGSGWTVELVRHDGTICEAEAPSVISDSTTVRRAILEDMRLDDPSRPRFVRDHAFPALRRLQELLERGSAIDEVIDFGTIPPDPDVSIIVPVFRRIDLLEHQLAHFVDDPEIGGAELVYVLDSPELADVVKEAASELHALYRVPFRVALLERHVGFGLAINAGVSISRGRLVLLLNSDVFPTQPGWVGRMSRFYDSAPQIGAVGPKLLFEDDTLQHAGLYFDRPVDVPVWMNRHYYKGFERRLPAANVVRRVPAVTGACLMIDRSLFLAQGGLRACYVDGDYEDSDLCLRLSVAGYESWYLPDVELYHLESQSYPWEQPRSHSASYNAWVHDHLWSDRIEAMMRQDRAPNLP